MKSFGERYAGWPLIIGIAIAFLALTAGPALAALTFSGTSISGDGAVVIDSSSTISIGTSTATGVTIGSSGTTTTFPGNVAIAGGELTYDTTLQSLSLQSLVSNDQPTLIVGMNPLPAPWVDFNTDSVAAVQYAGVAQNRQLGLSILLDGTDGNAGYGLYSFVQNDTGSNSTMSGVYSQVFAAGDDTASHIYGVWSGGGKLGTSTASVDAIDLFHADAPTGDPTTAYSYWATDLAGAATNPYYSWFDSQGVLRVKEDSSFNGVGQAIQALYNPLFTKYTPGAANYERIILGEWNSDVAEIGTENNGTGAARALAFITASTTRLTIGSTGNVSIATTTFSSLGTCNSGAEGSMRPVTDSTTSTLGATISGSGSNHVLAYCDGTNWTVMAK